jgi:hypothetical protein
MYESHIFRRVALKSLIVLLLKCRLSLALCYEHSKTRADLRIDNCLNSKGKAVTAPAGTPFGRLFGCQVIGEIVVKIHLVAALDLRLALQ